MCLQVVLHCAIAEGAAEALEGGDHERVGLREARDVEPVVGEAERRDVVVPGVEELRAVLAPGALLHVERREGAEELEVGAHVRLGRDHPQVLLGRGVLGEHAARGQRRLRPGIDVLGGAGVARRSQRREEGEGAEPGARHGPPPRQVVEDRLFARR